MEHAKSEQECLEFRELVRLGFGEMIFTELLNALLMLDLRSFGASFATLRAFWSTDSGIISYIGYPGGSDDTKHLKSA